jgi:hypothetical protein
MRFGLQIIGPRGGDALVLGVAACLERLPADDVRTARPVPDVGRLCATPAIAATEGFRDFGQSETFNNTPSCPGLTTPFFDFAKQDVDARNKSGHDGQRLSRRAMKATARPGAHPARS